MNYEADCARMLELVERDHGGCDDESCPLRKMLEWETECALEEIFERWACSGAADEEFEALYQKHAKRIRKAWLAAVNQGGDQ